MQRISKIAARAQKSSDDYLSLGSFFLLRNNGKGFFVGLLPGGLFAGSLDGFLRPSRMTAADYPYPILCQEQEM
jgi:hypothetical protein